MVLVSRIVPIIGRIPAYAPSRPFQHRVLGAFSKVQVEALRSFSSAAPKYVLAIDQGTTSSRAILFNKEGLPVATEQMEFTQHYPQPGWCEHDPQDIMDTVLKCCEGAIKKANATAADIAGIGITNQRETTVAWDRNTGKHLHKAIVWLDLRTSGVVAELVKDGGKDRFRAKTGLPVATYFSGVKMKWLLDNSPEVAAAAKEKRLAFGTIESWIIYNLTGGKDGGLHVSDCSNASRYMLMDLETLNWDEDTCKSIGIPMDALPEIRSNAEVYATVKGNGSLDGLKISSAIGDQHSALLGQGCLDAGTSKNTYGTGCFMILNTGNKIVPSKNGLLTTMGFKLGPDTPTIYALEGAVACAGRSVQWLRDNMGLIKTAPDIEGLAKAVEDTGGITIVPAFSGLFAPYWREDARAVMVGMTLFTKKEHVCRAMLEAVAMQTVDVMQAMEKDQGGVSLGKMRVDGGMTMNNFFMQMQADLLGVDVMRAKMPEATALGAAFSAGLATGFWDKVEDVQKCIEKGGGHEPFVPEMDAAARGKVYARWADAVKRTHNLAEFM